MSSKAKRVAVVTGASSGIGLAVSRKLAAGGYDLVVNGRNGDRLRAVAEELVALSARVIPVVGDASRPEVVDECVEACTGQLGEAVSVGVVNAGRGLPGTVMTSDDSQWSELFEVNVLGALRQMRGLAAAMCVAAQSRADAEHAADLVILGSNIGRNVSPFNSVYGATKFAVHGAAEGLRRELGPKSIRVSLIEPGIVRTPFQANAGYDPDWLTSYETEIGPFLSAEDVAELIEFVVSRPAHVHLNDVSIRPTRQDYP